MLSIEADAGPMQITASEISSILHIIRKPHSITALLFVQNIPKFLSRSHFLVGFPQNFSLFLGTVSGYKHLFYLSDTPQKENNIYRDIFCVFLHFFYSLMVRSLAISDFR